MIGYYKMQRGWMDNPVFHSEKFNERLAWIWLIENAVYKPQKVRVGEFLVSLERGQLAYSLRFLAQNWEWSKNRVRRFLRDLEKETMIRTSIETGVTVISVCNYNENQSGEKGFGTALNTAAGQKQDNVGTKNNKRINKRENKDKKQPPKFDSSFYVTLCRKRDKGELLSNDEKSYIEAYENDRKKQFSACNEERTLADLQKATVIDINKHRGNNLEFDAVMDNLKDVIGESTFNSWFASMQFKKVEDDIAYVDVETDFLLQYINDKYHTNLEEVWMEYNSDITKVEMVVRDR